MKINLTPQPQIIQIKEESFNFPDELQISFPEIDITADGYLKGYLTKQGFAINEDGENPNLVLRIDENFSPGGAKLETLGEAYSLKLSGGQIHITAKAYRGLFYGLVTLKKLVRSNGKELNEVEIIDYPDMRMRGISDDISRGQVSTLENFKKIIDFLADSKMNVYMPYIEDVLAFDKYPTIGMNRGALTKNEVKELVAYAKTNFIDVIPVFQTLGHYENILSQSEFVDYAEFPGAASLDVSNPKIYDFLDDLIREVTEIFPGEYLHVGADESFDVGLGRSKHLVDSSSIAEVHATHYKKVYEICKKYNRKMMMYGDIILRHPDILKLIPKDIIIVDWHYGARDYYDSAEKFKNNGFSYIVSPSVWNFLSTFPANINALANIKYLTKSGLINSSIGMINSNWGDYGAETFKELLYFGYAWSAQCAWSFGKSNISEFTETFYKELFGIFDSDVMLSHTLLSNPLNQVLWHEVWRHPLLKPKKPAWWEPQVDYTAKTLWNEMTLSSLSRSITYLETKVKRNSEQLEIWKYLTKLYQWYVLKSETTLLLRDTTKTVKERKPKLKNMIMENIARLESLKIEYKTIWKKYYKKDNLNMIEDKFNRLIQYFNETKNQLKKDTLILPLIPNKWCYAKTDSREFKEAEFEFKFDLASLPDTAKLQLLADTYAELYINGEFAGRVYARRTLSLLVDYKRILFIDIKKFLRKGNNTIIVVSKNYNSRGAAGFNLLSELSYNEDVDITVTSSDAWSFRVPGNEHKYKAAEEDYRKEVIAPNFKTNRTSWIER